MYDLDEIDGMVEAIYLVMDEHGILCDDGHWMTEDELYALPNEEVITLFYQIYGRD